MGGLAESLIFFISLFQSFPRLVHLGTEHGPKGLALVFSLNLLRIAARSGGPSFFSAPALLFFPFSCAWSAEMRFAQSAKNKTNTRTTKQNRPKWWKLADSRFRIHFSLLGTLQNISMVSEAEPLRFSTRSK
jgi:hypothetical protein